MKIRHKQSGATIKGNFVDTGTDFKEMTPDGYSLYYKKQWELVPEWRDVTAECECIHEGASIMHDGYVRFTSNMISGGYRLRKVHQTASGKCFIVEREQ